MKKKIVIALSIFSLVFFLGGIYIISAIETSSSKQRYLMKLHQIEIQRKHLLLRTKNVQSDLILKRTPHAKNFDTVINNVRLLEKMTGACLKCHHTEAVVKRLKNLERGVEEYKELVSRVLTIRANRERLMIEDDKAYRVAEQLLADVNSMNRLATSKLSEKTQAFLNDIYRVKIMLFVIVYITPFFVAVLGFIFMRGFTKPVEVLLTATRKISARNLAYRIPGLSDEFGEVAASFNEMASRLEKYTKRLERQTKKLEKQTLELEYAHNEMSTFCQVLKKIGDQQSLDGVGSFLMQELENILKTQYMQLYVFSSDPGNLFVLSEDKTTIIKEPELIQTVSTIAENLDGVSISRQQVLKPPLLPDDFPTEGPQTIIPFRGQNDRDGVFVVACTPDCLCDDKKLDLITLILEQVSGTIKRAVLHHEETLKLEGRIEKTFGYSEIIGKDPKMKVIYRLIDDVAPFDSTVLIQGETGTGKEMVANTIWQKSHRKDKPFVVINCSAYPDTLLESELFGHEEGSFTGATRQKAGRFEQADGGTVFLDEIGEISPSAQIKLLRVLQSQQFERLGGEQTLTVYVRVLAATNKDLLEEVENGNFREDLYYRLNVIPIHLPPLRMRQNDIPLLARHFLSNFAKTQIASNNGFSSEAMRRLLDYPWPGNVRELENSIEHAVVLNKGSRIELSHLPSAVLSGRPPPDPAPAVKYGTIMDNEKRLLMNALEQYNGNKTKTAQRLGISRQTLYDKLKRYQITKPADH